MTLDLDILTILRKSSQNKGMSKVALERAILKDQPGLQKWRIAQSMKRLLLKGLMVNMTGAGLSGTLRASKSAMVNKRDTHEAKPNSTTYEVEKIIDHQLVAGSLAYLVKWKGFDSDQNSWEQASSLQCHELIQEYEQQFGEDGPSQDREATVAQWEVERILEKKRSKGGWLYLVKWKGWSHDENSWEFKSAFGNPYTVEAWEIKQKIEAKLSQIRAELEAQAPPVCT